MLRNIDCTTGHKTKNIQIMEHGVLLSTQEIETQHNPIKKMHMSRWYNSLPKYLRDIESIKTEKFKFELDKFINSFLKGKKFSTMSPRQEATATVISYLIIERKDSTTAVEFPTRSRSRLCCLETTSSIPSIVKIKKYENIITTPYQKIAGHRLV